jgi:RimJ/RimL family protein N-acetyltransferase
MIDARAVSFCYPCWQTEGLWDVSVDTLEQHRGRSLGMAAVRFMIDHMRREGRAPVWGALASNRASLRLAAKLGFVPVDRIVVFSRGHWALLTGP